MPATTALTSLAPLLVVWCALLGLLIGSFLNVLIYRVPAGVSVVRPRSACPRCSAPIRSRDNVPVLSWLLLRGKCRDCQAPIAVRYPLLEALTGLLFACVAAAVAHAAPPAAPLTVLTVLPALLMFTAVTLVMAVMDFDTRTVPTRFAAGGWACTAVLLAASTPVTGAWGRLAWAAVGAAVLGLCAVLLTATRRDRAGGQVWGRVWSLALLGLGAGWAGWVPLVFLIAATAASAVAFTVTGRAGRRVRRAADAQPADTQTPTAPESSALDAPAPDAETPDGGTPDGDEVTRRGGGPLLPVPAAVALFLVLATGLTTGLTIGSPR